ncbi:hypothetical protein DUNSADRAFT_4243 [Dunaliella salina]|uniref:Uncharacterized protein n=1 Tax=Dunaliella salina TaxID=3046 RepID=A0ABQ7FUX0_DUNSA|nr:hypothetical protein DUNSADRAFT_4243 [Dunaliella salina]|eukprot:KAF5826190.1 hypothetical protein DUNSADRAFT_4243 [Dunaliella salina]
MPRGLLMEGVQALEDKIPPHAWDETSYAISKYMLFVYFPVFLLGCYAIAKTRWGPELAATVQARIVAHLERVSLLKVLPQEPYKLFRLGQVSLLVAHRLQQLEVQGDPNLVSEHRAALHQIMLEAKELLKQPLPEGMQVTPQLVLHFRDLLHQQMQSAPLAVRAKGFFKCANVMWVLGGFGVAVSIIPASVFVFGKFFKSVGEALKATLLTAHDVFQPFYMAIVLGGCLALLGASNRVPQHMAAQISFGSCLVATFAMDFGFNWYMENRGLWRSGVFWLFATATMLPFACVHKSQLLGFSTVGAHFFFWMLFVIPEIIQLLRLESWQWVTMGGEMVAGALLAILLVARRATPPTKEALRPFNLGLNVFGSIMLLLLGLINCVAKGQAVEDEDEYGDEDEGWSFWAIFWVVFWNVTYVPTLAALITLGYRYENATLFNMGCTFAYLYVVIQAVRTMMSFGSFSLGILLGSLGLCAGGYFIHTRPQWLAQMVLD